MTTNDYRNFRQGYLDCLIWQSLHWAGVAEDDSRPNPMSLDDVLDGTEPWDIHDLSAILADVRDFYRANLEDLTTANDEYGRPWDYLGQDFCLSRNGHGTGFWDRGMSLTGDRLHAASGPYGPQDADLYDGRLHAA